MEFISVDMRFGLKVVKVLRVLPHPNPPPVGEGI
jgi:hypothetical protein